MEKQILKAVEIRQPILEREITTILQKEFNLNKSKSEINSVLFRPKNKGVVRQNNEYKWSLAKQPSVENRQSQQNSSRQKDINDQTIKLDITQKQIVEFDLNGHLRGWRSCVVYTNEVISEICRTNDAMSSLRSSGLYSL